MGFFLTEAYGEFTHAVGGAANADGLSEDGTVFVLNIQKWKLFHSLERMPSRPCREQVWMFRSEHEWRVNSGS